MRKQQSNLVYGVLLFCLVGAGYFAGYIAGFRYPTSPTRLDLEATRKEIPFNTTMVINQTSTKVIHMVSLTPVKVKSVLPMTPVKVMTPQPRAPHIAHVDPMTLDLPLRFDIIVKTVYAIFLRRGTVPTFVINMYNRHLQVWNHFKEACGSGKDWFDKKNPCNSKGSAELFQQAFADTLGSIAKDGFDNNKSLVPVTESRFPVNGAHRVASALALRLPTMPVQIVARKVSRKWNFTFFTSKGFEEKYADFAMLQWTLHYVSNVSTVMFWPEAAADEEKMKQARVIVQRECGDILYEKTIKVSRHGVASLALHTYGIQWWLSAKITCLQTIFSGSDDDMRSISVFFIRPISTAHLITCKPNLRFLFALADPKSSVHIPDYHDEVVLVAEMVLNPNSVMFLNRHVGDNCREVASEVATRLEVPPVNPASFVLPQDIMVDSGAVMSFFGLRKRTDVDLLFQGNVTASVLGNQRGIHVEEHAFEHNRRVATRRAWGAEHLAECTVDDLFTDPQYYGYCHGIKFVSLTQLIRYKQRRGEPNKDDIDVSSLKRFTVGAVTRTA